MNTFYILEPIEGKMFGQKWACADVVKPKYHYNIERCPVCHKSMTVSIWAPPHYATLSSADPKKWGDVVWGAGFDLLVSERFKNIYEEEGLAGFQGFTGPVEFGKYGRKKPEEMEVELPRYYSIWVKWGGANQDDRLSEVVHGLPQEVKCSYCRTGISHRTQERVIIEEGSWDGSDVFRPRGFPAGMVVSEKLRQAAEKYHLTGFWLIPGEYYYYDERQPLKWVEMLTAKKPIWKSK